MPAIPAGTFIQYGNVRLFRVTTREFRQEPVFDPSGTDLLYYKTTIRVSGFLHGHTDWAYFHQIPYAANGNATAAHQAVRYQLPPRLPFLIAFGAVENDSERNGLPFGSVMEPATVNGQPCIIMQVNPAPANMTPPPDGSINLHNVDLHNGPKCLEFAVTHVTGNELFAVDATFEICKLECAADGTCPNNTYGVLSNRWSIEDSLDATMRTTRTYHGTTVFASANIDAHALRWLVAPPLQPLFRRERMSFVLSEDQLNLRWTVTDVEIAAAAPYPARRWNVQHTIRSNNAMMGVASVQVYVEGDSNVDKRDLIEIAIYIVSNRMFRKTPPEILKDPRDFAIIEGQTVEIFYEVKNFELTDHIGDVNAISASADVSVKLDSYNGMMLAMPLFGTPIEAKHLPPPLDGSAGGVGANYGRPTGEGYDRAKSWGGYAGQIPDVEGPAKIVGIFACYLQNPCDNNHWTIPSGYSLSNVTQGTQSETGRVPYTATVQTQVPVTANPIYSAAHVMAPYRYWQVDNKYSTDYMRVQMPIARRSPSPYTSQYVSRPEDYRPTSAVVTLGGPQCRRTIRISAERIGEWPQFPAPEYLAPFPALVDAEGKSPPGYQPIKQTVLSSELLPGTAGSTLTATGQVVYRASMEIVLALSRPPTPQELLPLGTDVWTNRGPQTTRPTLTNSQW